MNNTFKKWWTEEQKERQPISTYEQEVKMGWDACKQKVWEILKENTKNPNFTTADIIKAIEEIEKL